MLSALILGILRVNPEILLADYPPDIKAAWGPMTLRTKRQRPVAVGVMLVAVLAVAAISLHTLPNGFARHWTFAPAFLYFVTLFGVCNVFDWLVLDCGLVLFQPAFANGPPLDFFAPFAAAAGSGQRQSASCPNER